MKMNPPPEKDPTAHPLGEQVVFPDGVDTIPLEEPTVAPPKGVDTPPLGEKVVAIPMGAARHQFEGKPVARRKESYTPAFEEKPVAPPKIYEPPDLNGSPSLTLEGVQKTRFSPDDILNKDSASNHKPTGTLVYERKEGDGFAGTHDFPRPRSRSSCENIPPDITHVLEAVSTHSDSSGRSDSFEVISEPDDVRAPSRSGPAYCDNLQSPPLEEESAVPPSNYHPPVNDGLSATKDGVPPKAGPLAELQKKLDSGYGSSKKSTETFESTEKERDALTRTGSLLKPGQDVATHYDTIHNVPHSSTSHTVTSTGFSDAIVIPPSDQMIPSTIPEESNRVGSTTGSSFSNFGDEISPGDSAHSDISDSDSFEIISNPDSYETASCTSDPEDELISTSNSPYYELYSTGEKNFKMVLERGNVYDAFLNFYGKDISFLFFNMEHSFMNETGEGWGLTKEAFTLFHREGRDLHIYEGDKQLTPRTSGIESKVLARVLYHEFRLTRQFPSFLCTVFIIALITSGNVREYGKEYIMKSFINCVLHKNKAIFVEAANNGLRNMSLNDKSILFNEINMEMRAANLEPRNIDEGNWHEILLDLAHFVLIEKPSCREVIEEFQICMSIDDIPLYDMDEARKQVENTDPTAASILLKLKCVTETEAEEQAKGFLYRFIGSYFNNRDMAERFLIFCTSCTSLPFKRIKICFNGANGLARAVRANTCDNLLHVPTTYSTYGEFEEEFLAILSSHESLVFGFQ